MIKKNYYCLVAGLPDLFFSENNHGLSSLDFSNELKHQLNKTDYNLASFIYLQHDNHNLLNLVFERNKPFSLLGNYDKTFLERQIIKPIDIPNYMIRFLRWIQNFEPLEFNLQVENKLHSLYYEYVIETTKNKFLKEWFKFEMNSKNILTAINCQQFNYQPEKHLIQAGENNPVYSLLINRGLKHELFEEELPYAAQLFHVAESNISPEEKEKAIDKILWDYLDEQTFFHYFTIEKILSYIIKLGIVERWMKLDAETGKSLLIKLIQELKLSYSFPEEYSTVK